MRKFLFLLLIFLETFACSTPAKYFINSYDGEEGVNGWIQKSVLGYVGRYHEYPKSGMDLITYYEEGMKSYIEYGHDYEKGEPGPPIDFQKKVLLNEKCYYDSVACVISYGNEQYVLSKSISEWQNGFYKWLVFYYKPAFYNCRGEYMFVASEEMEEYFQKELSKFYQNHGTQIRVKIYDAFFKKEIDVPLRVRIKYRRGERVVLAESPVIPESAFSSGTILMEKSLRVFEPFLNNYLEKHDEIDAIDCLIPLLID